MGFPRHLIWLCFLVFLAPVRADDWPQFRGPERTGISKEKGLLPSWPEKGPKLLWTYRNTGLGFSSPSIVGERLYILGGWDEGEVLLCIDLKSQKELWKAKLGKLFQYENWGDGPRSTPTVDKDHIYALGGHGDLICVQAADGKEVWRLDLAKDLDGEMMGPWGYSESPLVDGDKLIVTPGGPKGTLAALDKKTGKVIWRSAGLTHAAPYSSARISNAAGVKQYIQTSYLIKEQEGFVSGFDAATGKPLWTEQLFKKHSYAIAPAPIVQGDLVYVTSGYGGGSHLFKISKSGTGLAAKDLYSLAGQRVMSNTHGGVVLIDGHIYGHSESQKWVCQDLKTGKQRWIERTEARTGAVVATEDRLYFYTEDGEAILVAADPKEWQEEGRFTIPERSKLKEMRPTLGDSAIWTHPVIANGRLYLRDQELLFCYDIKK